jgi:hypothetical protein
VEAELFHADGRTDLTKLIVAFRKFANARNESNLESSTGYVCNVLKKQEYKNKLLNHLFLIGFKIWYQHSFKLWTGAASRQFNIM